MTGFPTRRWTLILLGAAILLYFAIPWLLTVAARGLVREDHPAQADVIISLGGNILCQRETRAVEIYKQGLAPRLIFSGSPYAPGLDTSEVAGEFARSQGVPAAAIFPLHDGKNTRIEAERIGAMMRSQGWRSAIIVTSPYHSRRATYTFHQAAPDLTFYSMPTRSQAPEWFPERWWTRRGDGWRTVREFIAWSNTLLGGWK